MRACVLITDSGPLKEALTAEAKGWKILYGRLANNKFKNRMQQIFELIGKSAIYFQFYWPFARGINVFW